jgi:hypothetical protein
MYVTIAAVLLLCCAALVQLWGLKRQVAAIQAKRLQIKPLLQTTITGQELQNQTYNKLAGLVNAERGAPHWARAIYAITNHLPADSYVLGLRIAGDTVTIEGKGTNADDVLDNLFNVPGLTNVRNSTPVSNDPGPNGTPGLDHYNISAWLIPPAPPKPPAAAPLAAKRVAPGGKQQ